MGWASLGAWPRSTCSPSAITSSKKSIQISQPRFNLFRCLFYGVCELCFAAFSLLDSNMDSIFERIAIQTAILRAQSKYGTRFMIPKRFLPPKYNYSRPIPASLLPASNSSASSSDIVELGETSPTRAGANGTTRNRRGGSNREETPCMSEDTIETNTLDCIICHNEIDTNDPQGYMLTPCDHIFHRQCLEQWMDVKMECPVCRNSLPAT